MSLLMATVIEALLSRMPTLAKNSQCVFPLELSVLYFRVLKCQCTVSENAVNLLTPFLDT